MTDSATLAAALREAATPTLTLEDFGRVMQAAYEQMPRLEDWLTGRVTLIPGPSPKCSRCNDTKTVADSANWEPSWLWQRYRPVPRIPCPDCACATCGRTS